jgi:hypothetical protein
MWRCSRSTRGWPHSAFRPDVASIDQAHAPRRSIARRCEGGFAENFFPGPASVRELPAGRYYAKLWRYADDPGQVALRITVQ